VEVTLHSSESSAAVGWIQFREGRFSRGLFRCTGAFSVDGDEWSVELEMIGPHREMMLEFFEELGEQSSGWPGKKHWRSEFAQMYLDASFEGKGEVRLDVLMCWAPQYEIEQRGSLSVRADELPNVARRMRRFLLRSDRD
jgi:hypothetical protein